ncbi:MAG: signal peptidase I, partial [Pyramidobacter sp.]
MSIKGWWENLIAPVVRIWEKIVPWAWLRESLETVLWALVLALLLRTFVIQAFWIPSGSM